MAELSEHSKRAFRVLQGKSIKEAHNEFPTKNNHEAHESKAQEKKENMAKKFVGSKEYLRMKAHIRRGEKLY